jgi:hypothetical protein
MPETPWKFYVEKPEAEREYLAQATYLPLKSFWSLIRFLKLTLAIQKQLESSPGLVGYSMMAKIFSHRFWTLSVWNDQKSLTDFVIKFPHVKAMKDLRGKMGQTRFAKWTIKGSDLPPKWDDACAKLGDAPP